MGAVTTAYEAAIAAGTLRDDAAQRSVLGELERVHDALHAPVKKGFFRKKQQPVAQGLYLWGGVGRGKSMLMDLFVDTLGDVPARRVHFHAFMQEIHAAMHEARQRGVDDAIAPVAEAVAKEVRCLAFDEMQITDITDAMIVGRLFEALFAGNVLIVTTSNRVPDDLYKDGLNRQLFLPFIDLIKERMAVHEIVSPTDYRQDRLQGSNVYFSPLGREARQSMDQLWQDLAGGAAEPLILPRKGR
ncbi:MAG: cell division protein ZapE, partial [Rhodobacteraceae bacterium]|nr:cell division protein ZapE [Paracoccaceae bacterium]